MQQKEHDPVKKNEEQEPGVENQETSPVAEDITETAGTEEEIAKLTAELSELKDKYLRQAAEFDNYRKRTAREIVEMSKTAGKDVIISLLDVLDDCDRAQVQMQQTAESSVIKEGSTLIFNKMRNTLQAQGLKVMESIGKAFDPDLHEAVAEIPAPDAGMAGKVIDEVQKGYYLNDKIIRFAKVVVGK
jgi:molecular chaperone GrpE